MAAEYPPWSTRLHMNLDCDHAQNPGCSERLCQAILLAPDLGTGF